MLDGGFPATSERFRLHRNDRIAGSRRRRWDLGEAENATRALARSAKRQGGLRRSRKREGFGEAEST
jgi:hypothetical protein